MKNLDLAIIISSLTCLLILFGLLAYKPEKIVANQTVVELEEMVVKYLPLPTIKRKTVKEERYSFEEEPGDEFNCIMYATIPIGRYYITAYNDEETNCKITASGTKCHEGTITTCAADPRYHKFGDILEIDGRLFVVEDTGSAVKKRHIDLFFDSYKDMARYGSHYETIYRVEFPFGRPKYE